MLMVVAGGRQAHASSVSDEWPSIVLSDSTVQATAERVSSGYVLDQHELGPGEASYYGHELGGQPTASGELFDPEDLTAAHRTLPLGSLVRVTHARNGKSVVVRINDRGPSLLHRIIDVSEEAARRLGMLGAGTAMVHIEVLK